MIRYEPTLVVKRLVVDRGALKAYDQTYHKGVNVLRGENSSGKSTILNLLFYGLGGDLTVTDWSDVALLCDRVIVEVAINGNSATLSREISKQGRMGMDIFGGSYADSQRASVTDWIRYPYQRSENKESFSQALLRLLQIPEVRSEDASTITIHQLLRLLYADQLSPVDDIFRIEQFDLPQRREAIGRLLCGAYESKLYENQLQIKQLQRSYDMVSAELSGLSAVVAKSGQGLTLSWIDGERSRIKEEQATVQIEIDKAEKRAFEAPEKDVLTLSAQKKAYEEVQAAQIDLNQLQTKRDRLQLDIADSAAFIANLERKLSALEDTAITAEHFSDTYFSICPSCYAPLEKSKESHSCQLCKTPFNGEHIKGRIVALINDTSIQLRQSRLLQENRLDELRAIEGRLRDQSEKWMIVSSRLSSLQRQPVSETRQKLRELHHHAGYLQREQEDLERRARIVERIEELSAKKASLNDAIEKLRIENEKLLHGQEGRYIKARTAIADEVRKLLHNDLPRQAEFGKANEIQFDFARNIIRVDGHTYFSASSRAVLKSSFFLGFFAAATKNAFFRHPRFVMLDTTEDKGMEPERSHNLQREIARISRESPVEHQIIYATSMIAPELNNDTFTIGHFSTHDNPTLKIT